MSRQTTLDGSQKVTVKSRAEWRAWLEANYHSGSSIWLITYKKSEGSKYLPYEEMVEEALCFGWIDGLMRPLDEKRRMILLSPRRPKSVWSKLNKELAVRMIDAGLMQPAGYAKIECAKADGSWDRLKDADALVIPPDLEAVLKGDRGSREAFQALSESMRRRLLAYLGDAKTPATRARRVDEILRRAGVRGGSGTR